MVQVILMSYSNRVDAAKFVRDIGVVSLSEAIAVVDGELPAVVKEFASEVLAQQAINALSTAILDGVTYEIGGAQPAELIKTTGIGIVTGNPNEIAELQSNHLLSIVQLQDGVHQWKFMPNNDPGEKWVLMDVEDASVVDFSTENLNVEMIDCSETVAMRRAQIHQTNDIGSNLPNPPTRQEFGQIRNIINTSVAQPYNKVVMCVMDTRGANYPYVETFKWHTLYEKTLS